MRQPRWNSRWNRPLALGELLLQPLLVIPNVLLYGATEAWVSLPRHWRFLVKTIRTGRTGPSRGITW